MPQSCNLALLQHKRSVTLISCFGVVRGVSSSTIQSKGLVAKIYQSRWLEHEGNAWPFTCKITMAILSTRVVCVCVWMIANLARTDVCTYSTVHGLQPACTLHTVQLYKYSTILSTCPWCTSFIINTCDISHKHCRFRVSTVGRAEYTVWRYGTEKNSPGSVKGCTVLRTGESTSTNTYDCIVRHL